MAQHYSFTGPIRFIDRWNTLLLPSSNFKEIQRVISCPFVPLMKKSKYLTLLGVLTSFLAQMQPFIGTRVINIFIKNFETSKMAVIWAHFLFLCGIWKGVFGFALFTGILICFIYRNVALHKAIHYSQLLCINSFTHWKRGQVGTDVNKRTGWWNVLFSMCEISLIT